MFSSEVVAERSTPDVRARVDDVRLGVVRLASLTLDAIRSGTDAFVDGELDHAGRVAADGGVPVDDTRLNAAVQLALVARHYERIGDHSVTIAEQVHFVATGERTRSARFRR